MIYVVSGLHRSGTTMAMECLEAGGLSVVRFPGRDRVNERASDDDYRPNPHGLYEPNLAEMRVPGWPAQYDGMAIKVLCPWLRYLSPHKYRVLFMRRDPEEIRQSAEASFNIRMTVKQIEAQVEAGLAAIRERDDVAMLTEVEYADVIEHPHAAFDRLYLHGWPIDAARAAAVVDPKLYRFQRDKLTVGI